MPAEEV
jgi:hypothetical protein